MRAPDVQVLTKQGGAWTDDTGKLLKRWLWDPRRQGAGTQPSEPIAFALNPFLSFEYIDKWVSLGWLGWVGVRRAVCGGRGRGWGREGCRVFRL